MSKSDRFVLFNYWFCIQSIICFIINYADGQLNHYHHEAHYNNASPAPYKCSRKLEDTLDSMLRRNRLKFGKGGTRIDVTPYSKYHSLYSNWNEFDSTLNEKLDIYDRNYSADESMFPNVDEDIRKGLGADRKHPVDKIEVAEMRVRLPNDGKQPWVLVDKCQFNAHNRTLDTRLVFPDLSISGRVILQPSGGYCNMMLRLRRAGIEFRTTPLAPAHDHGEASERTRLASVRTDSHFSEPGFLSVFAYGCKGPSGITFRKNSKLNRFNNHEYQTTADKTYRPYDEKPIKRSHSPLYAQRRIANSMGSHQFFEDYAGDYRTGIRDAFKEDEMILKDELFDDSNESNPERSFSTLFNSDNDKYASRPPKGASHHQSLHNWYNAELSNSNEVNEALTRELEQLFSIGVRGLLTTYMQKALQPAIKETLMENMGYVLSYG